MSLHVFLADYLILVFPILLLKFFKDRNWVLFIHTLSASIAAWLIAQFFKEFFYIPRPYIIREHLPLAQFLLDGSFPSGHTALSFAFSFSAFTHHRPLGLTLLILSLFIGTSRVVAFVHYPLDILGGTLIGLSAAYLTSFLNYAHIAKLFSYKPKKGRTLSK